MLGRITALDPNGGTASLGWIRTEKDINQDKLLFNTHSFRIPRNRGSLGLETLLKLLRMFMIACSIGADLPQPRVQPIAVGKRLLWK